MEGTNWQGQQEPQGNQIVVEVGGSKPTVRVLPGYLQPFLNDNQDLSPKVMDHLQKILDDPEQSRDLEQELAALIDVGHHFVKATYRLEGDGSLVFSTYCFRQELLTACNVALHPNIQAVANELADGDAAYTAKL